MQDGADPAPAVAQQETITSVGRRSPNLRAGREALSGTANQFVTWVSPLPGSSAGEDGRNIIDGPRGN